MQIPIQPLTPERFKPYGDLIELPAPGPTDPAKSQRFPGGDCLDFGGATPTLDVLYIAARPLQIDFLERHRNSSQTFLPLGPEPFVVVVGPLSKVNDGTVDPSLLEAFLSTGNQGVNFRHGVWHHPLLPLKDPLVTVILHRSPDVDLDTQVTKLPEPITLVP